MSAGVEKPRCACGVEAFTHFALKTKTPRCALCLAKLWSVELLQDGDVRELVELHRGGRPGGRVLAVVLALCAAAQAQQRRGAA